MNNNFFNESANTIDSILSFKQASKAENKAHVEEQKMVIDVSYFFDKDKGYFNKEEFVSFATSLKKKELEGLEMFFNNISKEQRLKTQAFPCIDKAGKPYFWISVNSKMVTSEYKLVVTEGLQRLLQDYSNSIYHFNLSLESLFEAAVNTNN